MNVQHLRDVQLQPLDVLVKIDGELRRRWIRLGPWTRMKRIGLNQHFLFRQVRHQQTVMMQIATDMVQLERVGAIGQHALVGEPFDGSAPI